MAIDMLPGPGKESLHEGIDKLFRRATGGHRAAFAICYTLPPDYDECHWATNVSRKDGIALFEETAIKMRGQTG